MRVLHVRQQECKRLWPNILKQSAKICMLLQPLAHDAAGHTVVYTQMFLSYWFQTAITSNLKTYRPKHNMTKIYKIIPSSWKRLFLEYPWTFIFSNKHLFYILCLFYKVIAQTIQSYQITAAKTNTEGSGPESCKVRKISVCISSFEISLCFLKEFFLQVRISCKSITMLLICLANVFYGLKWE